jgi:hypothetical protein
MKWLNAIGSSIALFALVFLPSIAKAQDRNEVIVPAGTLLRCTLDEPNFSTKTAEVGDPVLCHLNQLLLFDRDVFPRGAYLGGHLEAAKEPGHFIGKGYLKLVFDHIGLPDAELPVPAKVIAADKYKVDKQGKIDGHGHAKRDAVEWMFPPLWPIKVVTLPNRGPRPVLKGEEQLTLRLMDDVAVPAMPMMGWHYFGQPSGQGYRSGWQSRYVAPPSPAPQSAPSRYSAQPAPATAPAVPASNPSAAPAAAPAVLASNPSATPARNVLVLLDGTSYTVNSLHVAGDQIGYTLPHGQPGAVKLTDVDWAKTFQANSENGLLLAVDNNHAN